MKFWCTAYGQRSFYFLTINWPRTQKPFSLPTSLQSISIILISNIYIQCNRLALNGAPNSFLCFGLWKVWSISLTKFRGLDCKSCFSPGTPAPSCWTTSSQKHQGQLWYALFLVFSSPLHRSHSYSALYTGLGCCHCLPLGCTLDVMWPVLEEPWPWPITIDLFLSCFLLLQSLWQVVLKTDSRFFFKYISVLCFHLLLLMSLLQQWFSNGNQE